MKKVLVWCSVLSMTLLFLLGAGLASAASGASAPVPPRQVERSLETLSLSVAGALGERDFRELLHGSLAASSGGSVSLRDLLEKEVSPGSTVAQRLAAGLSRSGRGTASSKVPSLDRILGILEKMPDIEVRVAPGLAAWEADQTPLATYARANPPSVVQAFAPGGARVSVDTRQPFTTPIVVLEYHDTHDAVEVLGPVPAAPAASPVLANVSAPLYAQCTDTVTYRSYPLITGAAIWDNHEGWDCCNGPTGFTYFAAAGVEKTGNLPASLGGETGWSTFVWASNHQGPMPVYKARDQWEWTAKYWVQETDRRYPAVYCQQAVNNPASFALTSYKIMEDDDGPLSVDDDVGKIYINHSFCKSEVFDLGLASGWTSEHTWGGTADIVYTRAKLYCYQTTACNASTQCPDGTLLSCNNSGTCGQGACMAGEDWIQCGSTYQDCSTPEPCPHGQILCDPL
jgi:hypothetical protein